MIIAVLFLLPLLIATPLAAQTTEYSGGLFYTLRVAGEHPELFYDHQGKRVAFSSRIGAISRPHPKPPGGIVMLYREVPASTPEAPPVRVPVTQLNLGPSVSSLVLLSAAPTAANPTQSGLSTYVMDHSLEAHPASSIRIINLCTSPVTMQVGAELGEYAPTQSRIIRYPSISEDYLSAKAALLVNGSWHVRLNNRLRVIHGNAQNATTRAIWVLTSPPPSSEDPEPRIFVRNIIDFIPPASNPLASAR